jgi:hypothetical protein
MSKYNMQRRIFSDYMQCEKDFMNVLCAINEPPMAIMYEKSKVTHFKKKKRILPFSLFVCILSERERGSTT